MDDIKMSDILRRRIKAFTTQKVFVIGIVLGASFWVADSVIDAIIFKDHTLVAQLFRPEGVEVWVRLFVFVLFVIFGFYSNATMKSLIKAKDGLKKAHDNLERQVKERTAELEHEKSRTEASLREKEVLLQEIHHRVKNNMQIISSLLKLQASYITDEETIRQFKESQNRVRSMALIHERLYMSKDLANIDFREYVHGLIKSMRISFGSGVERVRFIIDMNDIILNTDTAIPCGLIITELISNAVKYAFPDGRDSEIRIKAKRFDTNEIELIVFDNGVGIPEGVDLKNPGSLGLELVTLLAEKQLGGTVELSTDKGTEFRILLRELPRHNKT